MTLPELSNSGRLPGRAGGTPAYASDQTFFFVRENATTIVPSVRTGDGIFYDAGGTEAIVRCFGNSVPDATLRDVKVLLRRE